MPKLPHVSSAKQTQNWVLIGFMTALAAVGIMAAVTMFRANEVKDAIYRSQSVDLFRSELLGLMADLYDAENSVRTYALTQDRYQFKKFHTAQGMHERRLSRLAELAAEMKDSLVLQQVDRLKPYLGLKYQSMRDLAKVAGAEHHLRELYRRLLISADSFRFEDYEAELDSNGALVQYFFPLDSVGLSSADLPEGANADTALVHSLGQIQQAQERIRDRVESSLSLDEKSMVQVENVVSSIQRHLVEQSNVMAEVGEDAESTFYFIYVFGFVVLIMELAFLWFIINSLDRNRMLQAQLQAEKERAEHLAGAKEEFLANMSHEIRTPMNAVIGFADQLHSTTLNRQQHRLLDPLRHSAGYLLALINDVLDYSKLESGDFPLEKVGLSPKDILKETEETFFEQAKAKGLALKCMADPNLPPVVLGDPLRLKQMLFNLMSNALKFTESGSVVLRASRQPHSVATMAKLQFEVKDTGIGIPLEKQENIFSKFIQADTSTTRRYGGTGLGLAITKRLAEIQEGELTLVSEVGRGTTVTLVLPQQLGTEQDLLPDLSDSPLDAATLAGRSVLLVDDELYNRELAQYVLNKWKVKVKSVESGVKALMHLERGEPVDLILMDLQMPNKDGFETTRLIREKLGLRDIPILAMTATSTPSEIQRAYAVGMNAHLLKPFRESDLLGLMLRLVDPGQANSQPPTSPKPATKGPKSAEASSSQAGSQWTGYDRERALKAFNGDEAFMKKMLGIFVRQTKSQAQQLLDLQAQGNSEELGKVAHALVPRCRNLGLLEAVSHLKQMEEYGNRGELVSEKEIGRLVGFLNQVISDIERDLKA